MLTFEESSHTYLLRIGDEIRRVPSVTEILDQNAFYPNNGAADRGTRIHKAIAAGIACEDVDKDIEPWMQAWWDFCMDWQVVPILCETVIYSKTYGYAGTFDMIAMTSRGCFLIDFKTGIVPKWCRQQTAAYLYAALEYCGPDARITTARRLALQIAPDGYKVQIHDHTKFETDFAAFLRARKVFEQRQVS